MSAKSSASPSNKLPKKEAEIFKTIVNCYETKQYDKGLKSAETILKRFPKHGETLAMKGLILNCIGRKTEGFEFVKLGLTNDIGSHICWHVYGLIYRSDNNYKEASKCYLQALKKDPNNQNILRDLSWLQIQMRDISGFIESRRKILITRPTMRVSWVAFAFANYLGEYYGVAYDTVARYLDNISTSERGEKYEESELMLFQNKCLEQQGKYEEGLQHLITNSKIIVDKYAMKIKSAEYSLKLRNYEDAKEKWLDLVLYQVDNYHLHRGLQCAYLELDPKICETMLQLKVLELPSTTISLTPAQREVLKELYSRDDPKFQKSQTIIQIKLTFLDSEELRELLCKHCRHCLSEGVPSLYHDICSLIRYANPLLTPQANGEGFIQTYIVNDSYEFRIHPLTVYIRKVIETYIDNLEKYSTFTLPENPENINESDIQPPTALLWSYFLYCHILEKSGYINEAMVAINKCLDHTPTALDMYLKKGKLLKKMMLFKQAAETVDYGRTLDLQDRYLNNKATKYLLRADLVPEAMETVAMFTKHDGDPQKTLCDLQCNWYELELAESYSRTKQWGLALKKYYDVQHHFADHIEDMFDFHNYSFRKTTLRTYMDALRVQDESYAHKFFQRAATGVINIYLHLIDSPEDIDGLGHLSAKERKKEREKLKKKKAKEIEFSQKLNSDKSSNSLSVTSDLADTTGEKFLTGKNFLQEAESWCHYLMPCVKLLNLDLPALLSEVHFRRNKYLQSLRCIYTHLHRSPYHPGLCVQLVKLARRVKGQDSGIKTLGTIKETTLAILREEVDHLLHGLDITTYINQYTSMVEPLNSWPHTLGIAKMMVANAGAKTLHNTKVAAAELFLKPELWSGRGLTANNIVEAFKYVVNELKMEVQGEQFRLKCAEMFPNVKMFQRDTTDSSSQVAGADVEIVEPHAIVHADTKTDA